MRRILIAGAALVAAAGALPAASPAVDQAIKTIEAVGNDPAKLKAFCALNKFIADAGETNDQAIEKKIDDQVAQIGADFKTAWDTGEDLTEDSDDGKAFYAAVDALIAKCGT
jgi:hypothetical protein